MIEALGWILFALVLVWMVARRWKAWRPVCRRVLAFPKTRIGKRPSIDLDTVPPRFYSAM